MWRNILVLLTFLGVTTTSIEAGWFGPDKETVVEREQRIQAEEQLKAAQQRLSTQDQQIDGQERVISKLRWTTTLVIPGAVILLIIGVAMGSRTRRDAHKH